MAANQDYRAFFEREFQRRRVSLYPPFTIMARILAESRPRRRPSGPLRSWRSGSRAGDGGPPGLEEAGAAEVHGASGHPPAAGHDRRQILFKLLTGPETDDFCAFLTERAESAGEGVRAFLEVNPVNMI